MCCEPVTRPPIVKKRDAYSSAGAAHGAPSSRGQENVATVRPALMVAFEGRQ
jgi:hypothetical protein